MKSRDNTHTGILSTQVEPNLPVKVATGIINPWRTCTVRVTIDGCVVLSVC